MDKGIDTYDRSTEFIGRTSRRFLSFGNGLSLVTLLCLLIFGFFVSFNQTIQAEALITSNPPPVTLLSRIDGNIKNIYIASGDKVEKGDILAVLESSGNFKDIIYLDSILSLDQGIKLNIDKLLTYYPTSLKLGPTIQTAYTVYVESYLSHILLTSLDIEQGNINSLEERKNSTYNQISSKRQQLENDIAKLKSGEKDLERYTTLYNKGVLADSEIDIEKRKYLDLMSQKSKSQEELESLRISLSDISNQSKSSQSSLTKSNVMSLSKVQLERQKLISEISFWKEQYLFSSPIKGKVSTYDSWHNNQEVKEGENILTIVPVHNGNIFAKCKVAVNNTGSLKKGQKVLIHIDNYPYAEWGALIGRVKTVSDVPKLGENPYYLVDVELDNLDTNFDKTLEFRQNMNGKAYILLNELSLFQRVVYNLRKTFSQK
jgi:multidrug resistance efflux pump